MSGQGSSRLGLRLLLRVNRVGLTAYRRLPLYQWTKATIENPAKKEKYLKSFTLYVDDREVYAKEIADALEADLQPLATSGLITRISKYDTNPANNPQLPQAPRERS